MGHALRIDAPTGIVTVAFDGTRTTATAAGGGSIAVELDVFDSIEAAYEGLYSGAGGNYLSSIDFSDGKYVQVRHMGDDPGPRWSADCALWKALERVAPQWLPSLLPDIEIRELAEAVSAASLAAKEAKEARLRSRTNATVEATIAANRVVDEANDELYMALNYQAYVGNVLAAVGRGEAPIEVVPPTTRLSSDRPRGRT